MKWDGINEFISVAEYSSFTQAAKHLGISTAQVSRQVSRLEKRLKTKLLYRTTRKVSLTEEGSVFYQRCRVAIDGLDAAEQLIHQMHAEPQGSIRLTAPVTYGEQKLLPLINDFMVRYRDISVNAFLSNQTVDLVSEGYDLAVRIGQLNDSTMMAKKLSGRTNFVCASPSYLDHHGVPVALEDLRHHQCLLGSVEYWRFDDLGRRRNIHVSGRVRYNSGYSLTDAALKGLGIVQLPDYYVQPHIKSGRLISILDDYRVPEESIWAVYPHNQYTPMKIKLLIEHLAKNM